MTVAAVWASPDCPAAAVVSAGPALEAELYTTWDAGLSQAARARLLSPQSAVRFSVNDIGRSVRIALSISSLIPPNRSSRADQPASLQCIQPARTAIHTVDATRCEIRLFTRSATLLRQSLGAT